MIWARNMAPPGHRGKSIEIDEFLLLSKVNIHKYTNAQTVIEIISCYTSKYY